MKTENVALDVSDLPVSELDHRSLVWWGNVLMMVIETTVFALLVASYLYVRMNFGHWPPPQPNRFPPLAAEYPSIPMGLTTVIPLLISLIPMIWADRAALKLKANAVRWGLFLSILAGGVIAYLRFRELRYLPFDWDDNAYASIVWTLCGMHLMHIVVATCENIVMFAWAVVHSLDKKHARDVRVNAVYWYWVVGIWVLLFCIIYVGPRI